MMSRLLFHTLLCFLLIQNGVSEDLEIHAMDVFHRWKVVVPEETVESQEAAAMLDLGEPALGAEAALELVKIEYKKTHGSPFIPLSVTASRSSNSKGQFWLHVVIVFHGEVGGIPSRTRMPFVVLPDGSVHTGRSELLPLGGDTKAQLSNAEEKVANLEAELLLEYSRVYDSKGEEEKVEPHELKRLRQIHQAIDHAEYVRKVLRRRLLRLGHQKRDQDEQVDAPDISPR